MANLRDMAGQVLDLTLQKTKLSVSGHPSGIQLAQSWSPNVP